MRAGDTGAAAATPGASPGASPGTRRGLGLRGGLAGGLLALVCAGAVAQAAPAAAGGTAAPPAATAAAAGGADRAAAIELGRRTYVGMCARCHGINLVTQGIGFDLRRFPADGQERFRTSVLQGVRAMPAFGSSLSPVQVDGLWAYIGSVNGWTP